MKLVKNLVRRSLNRLGYNIVRLSKPVQPTDPLVDQLNARDISVVLDVGANIGQYAQWLRHFGYRQRIVSFEPVSAAFEQLEAQAASDALWEAVNFALGDSSYPAQINVSRNLFSSSIRDLEQKTLEAEPSVEYLYSEPIVVEPLDSVFGCFASPADRVFLKVDVQGYENQVFQGAQQSLSRLEGVILECSMSRLYKGEWLFHEVVGFFASRGFILSNIEREFCDHRTGELLQVNTLFWNASRNADSTPLHSEAAQ